MKPRIGITFSSEIKVEPYAEAVRASGGEPVPISPGTISAYADLDGFVLGGGVDVNPSLYGENAAPETEEPDHARDRLEQDVLEVALRQNVPVLAICRGMQMLNVAMGGSLVQHMNGHVQRTEDKALPAHTVKVAAGSKMEGWIQSPTVEVNSRHHQALAELGSGLTVSARAEDGTVEAVEHANHRFLVGVQWHPEDMVKVDSRQKRLFDAFIQAAKE